MSREHDRIRRHARAWVLAAFCCTIAGSALAADEWLAASDPGEADGATAALDERTRALIEQLHQGTRALGINGGSESAPAAIAAAKTFGLVAGRSRTPAQRVIEQMAAHQARYSNPSEEFVRAGLAALWKVHEPVRQEPSTVDVLVAMAVERNFAVVAAGGLECCTCSSPAQCDDGVFCNGSESCESSICTPGGSPCVDGNPCTTDSCNEAGGSCSYSPVPPPNDVASLTLGRPGPGSPVAALSWSSVSGASDYNVYRAPQPNLSGLACYSPGVAGTTLNDDGATPPIFLYLVSSATQCGESSLGSGTFGPRSNPAPCP
jgi:hypothetical protein